MTPILTSAQMREADRRAIEDHGMPSLILMENAARGACDLLYDLMEGFEDAHIVILCGKGNNGGDGLALARHVINGGGEVTAVLMAQPSELSEDATVHYQILRSMAPEAITDWNSFSSLYEDVGYDAIVDAMLGTGAKGPPEPLYADAIAWSNEQDLFRMAIDIATGVDADTGAVPADAFAADATATMGALKPGLLLGEGADTSGDLFIIDIGAPPRLYATSGLELLDVLTALEGVPMVERARNKYDRGKVLVVAGSRGMTGAGVLAAEASVRAGAGLTVLALPASEFATLPQRVPPEIMTMPLAATEEGTFTEEALVGIDTTGYRAIAIGPGLSRSEAATAGARSFVRRTDVPVILDADGLNAFAGAADLLADRQCQLVITPHHGEMARLLGVTRDDVAADPVATARRAASRLDCVVVLKGAPTIVAARDGRAWINSVGNPAMASGGVGDALTGTIAALVAQTNDPLTAALTGVFLHSHAGDIATEQRGTHSLTASDIIAHLSDAYLSLESQLG